MKRYDITGNGVMRPTPKGDWVFCDDPEAAIKAAVAAEREACAFVCQDVMPVKYESPPSFAERHRHPRPRSRP